MKFPCKAWFLRSVSRPATLVSIWVLGWSSPAFTCLNELGAFHRKRMFADDIFAGFGQHLWTPGQADPAAVIGKVLALNGVVQLTERDEHFYHEMLAQVALHAHPSPTDVLIIGGGDGGTLREVLKHKVVERALVVELDREVIETSKEFFPTPSTGFADSRTQIVQNPPSSLNPVWF